MTYINKEDLLATINEVWERKYVRCNYQPLSDVYRMIIRRINRAPVADVVNVVRCKNCKYYEPYKKPVEDFDGKCFARNCETDEQDFCNYGERETYK